MKVLKLLFLCFALTQLHAGESQEESTLLQDLLIAKRATLQTLGASIGHFVPSLFGFVGDGAFFELWRCNKLTDVIYLMPLTYLWLLVRGNGSLARGIVKWGLNSCVYSNFGNSIVVDTHKQVPQSISITDGKKFAALMVWLLAHSSGIMDKLIYDDIQ